MIKQSKFSNGINFRYKLLIGLGNPGPDYTKTYHNAGSFFIDLLSDGKKFKKADGFVYLKTGGVILVKPLSFMNESGHSVKKAFEYFKVTPAEALIIHDDSDLSMGEFRFAANRGTAGHNGVKSIMDVCKTNDINRLRLGVRRDTPGGRLKAGDFVLKIMGKKDMAALQDIADNLRNELLNL